MAKLLCNGTEVLQVRSEYKTHYKGTAEEYVSVTYYSVRSNGRILSQFKTFDIDNMKLKTRHNYGWKLFRHYWTTQETMKKFHEFCKAGKFTLVNGLFP